MPQAASLLALQDLDIEILRAKKRLDELPEKHEILVTRSKIRDVNDLHGRADALVAKLSAELKAYQDETEMLTEKIDAEQVKVSSTTDHRVAQSITREMDGLRRRRDKIEMESLQLMERIDKAKTQTDKIDEALMQLADKDAALVVQYKSVGGQLQKDIADMQSKRTALATSMDADTLKRYESIRESRGGVGVGRLEGDACSACRMTLPTTRVLALQAGPDIAICPQCRRLIVVRTGLEE